MKPTATFQLKTNTHITDQDGKTYNPKNDKPEPGKTYHAHIQLTRYDNRVLTKQRDLKLKFKTGKTE